MSDTPTYPPTKAQQYLADNEAAMRTAIEALRATLEDQAAQMTKAQLMEGVTGNRAGVKAPTASAAKALWEGAWVEVQVRTSGQQKEHNDARYAVAEERGADAAVQAILDEADELVAKLQAELAGDGAGIHTLSHWLQWNAVEAAALAEAAHFARRWRAARSRGAEPRELAAEMIQDCLRQLLCYTGSSNLKVSGHGIAEAAKAHGPKVFLRAVTRMAPDDMLPFLF